MYNDTSKHRLIYFKSVFPPASVAMGYVLPSLSLVWPPMYLRNKLTVFGRLYQDIAFLGLSCFVTENMHHADTVNLRVPSQLLQACWSAPSFELSLRLLIFD